MIIKPQINLISFIRPISFGGFTLGSKWERSLHGWGNGYVLLPKFHPLYEVHYDDNNSIINEIEVYGGITYSGPYNFKADNTEFENNIQFKPNGSQYWVLGFDTAHGYEEDNSILDKEFVIKETKKLKDQLIKIYYDK